MYLLPQLEEHCPAHRLQQLHPGRGPRGDQVQEEVGRLLVYTGCREPSVASDKPRTEAVRKGARPYSGSRYKYLGGQPTPY